MIPQTVKSVKSTAVKTEPAVDIKENAPTKSNSEINVWKMDEPSSTAVKTDEEKRPVVDTAGPSRVQGLVTRNI